MGHWGVKSYENDVAFDALDSAFDRVHGARYEDLMDDRNPLTLEQVQERLASAETLQAAVEVLRAEFGDSPDQWDEIARLALVGVVVRHAELRVALPEEIRTQAREWLQDESIDWHEATLRRLRREAELRLLGP